MHLPMPVIVGVPRSGTTLLRIMLDAHSALAIPPETGFLLRLAALDGAPGDGRAAVEAITGAETWPDFHLDATAFEAAIARLAPCTPAEVARTLLSSTETVPPSAWTAILWLSAMVEFDTDMLPVAVAAV